MSVRDPLIDCVGKVRESTFGDISLSQDIY